MPLLNQINFLEDSKIGAIILAAGASSRLGFPKQLVQFGEITLLEHSISAALEAQCSPVIVVLGANLEIIKPKIKNYPIHIVENQAWHEGIGASIRVGIHALDKLQHTKAVILMLCDQPYVSSALLNELKDKYQSSSAMIIASFYKSISGVPALFDKAFFEELKTLKGDEGARKLIIHHQDKLETIPFPNGEVDIDYKEDLIGTQGIKASI